MYEKNIKELNKELENNKNKYEKNIKELENNKNKYEEKIKEW